eukprot:764673-Hanusia_phi.AAC.4
MSVVKLILMFVWSAVRIQPHCLLLCFGRQREDETEFCQAGHCVAAPLLQLRIHQQLDVKDTNFGEENEDDEVIEDEDEDGKPVLYNASS